MRVPLVRDVDPRSPKRRRVENGNHHAVASASSVAFVDLDEDDHRSDRGRTRNGHSTNVNTQPTSISAPDEEEEEEGAIQEIDPPSSIAARVGIPDSRSSVNTVVLQRVQSQAEQASGSAQSAPARIVRRDGGSGRYIGGGREYSDWIPHGSRGERGPPGPTRGGPYSTQQRKSHLHNIGREREREFPRDAPAGYQYAGARREAHGGRSTSTRSPTRRSLDQALKEAHRDCQLSSDRLTRRTGSSDRAACRGGRSPYSDKSQRSIRNEQMHHHHRTDPARRAQPLHRGSSLPENSGERVRQHQPVESRRQNAERQASLRFEKTVRQDSRTVSSADGEDVRDQAALREERFHEYLPGQGDSCATVDASVGEEVAEAADRKPPCEDLHQSLDVEPLVLDGIRAEPYQVERPVTETDRSVYALTSLAQTVVESASEKSPDAGLGDADSVEHLTPPPVIDESGNPFCGVGHVAVEENAPHSSPKRTVDLEHEEECTYVPACMSADQTTDDLPDRRDGTAQEDQDVDETSSAIENKGLAEGADTVGSTVPDNLEGADVPEEPSSGKRESEGEEGAVRSPMEESTEEAFNLDLTPMDDEFKEGEPKQEKDGHGSPPGSCLDGEPLVQATASESSGSPRSIDGETARARSASPPQRRQAPLLYQPIAPLLYGCRSTSEYKKLNIISEGTYGEVFRAVHKPTGEIVALKQIKFHKKLWTEGFPLLHLREISTLLELNHPNIIDVREVVVGEGSNSVCMVMEYVEHEIKVLLETGRPQFSLSERKGLLKQLLGSAAYMHQNYIMHRDLKTSNLLYSNKGLLKVCDFGMARKHGDCDSAYSQNVVTLWYRAPELLLRLKHYDEAVDVWSIGCIFAEILLGRPLFNAKTELEAVNMVFQLVGAPSKEGWPKMYQAPMIAKGILTVRESKPTWRQTFLPPEAAHGDSERSLSQVGLDLLSKLLEPNPDKRITAREALNHDYFKTDRPAPAQVCFMPTVPETNAMLRKHIRSSPNANRVNAETYLSRLEHASGCKTSASGMGKGDRGNFSSRVGSGDDYRRGAESSRRQIDGYRRGGESSRSAASSVSDVARSLR